MNRLFHHYLAGMVPRLFGNQVSAIYKEIGERCILDFKAR